MIETYGSVTLSSANWEELTKDMNVRVENAQSDEEYISIATLPQEHRQNRQTQGIGKTLKETVMPV